MWIEKTIYSVKAKSQAGNMNQIYNENIKKDKAERKSARVLKNSCILPENLAEGLGSR